MDGESLIILSIPVFVLLIAIEVAFNWLKHGTFYRVNDGISNLSAGILHQIFGFLPKAVAAFCYTAAHQQFGLFTDILSSDRWWVWVLLFFSC